MSILMGLLTALAWGITDFLIGFNARNVGVLRSLMIGSAISLVLLLVSCLIWFPGIPTGHGIGIYALAGVSAALVVGGSLLLSRAFRDGKISVIAPLVTTYGCFTTLFASVAGSLLSTMQYVAIGLCTLGVMLTTQNRQRRAKVPHPGILPTFCALASAAAWGLSFWLQGEYILKVLLPIHMLLLNSFLGFVVAGSVLKIASPPAGKLDRSECLYLAGASCMNLIGFAFFTTGLALDSPAIITVLSTLSGAVASLIAMLFLKERASAPQMVGGFIIIGGAMLLTVSR